MANLSKNQKKNAKKRARGYCPPCHRPVVCKECGGKRYRSLVLPTGPETFLCRHCIINRQWQYLPCSIRACPCGKTEELLDASPWCNSCLWRRMRTLARAMVAAGKYHESVTDIESYEGMTAEDVERLVNGFRDLNVSAA